MTNLFNPVFYKSGKSGVSAVVGYESKSNRVVRYNLLTGSGGANRIELSFNNNWQGNGTLPNTLYFYIGTDPDDHSNAGATSERTGDLTRASGTYNYSGAADMILMPNTTYYVWVFPSSTTFGWVQWSYASGNAQASLIGGAIATLQAEPGTLGIEQTLKVTRYNADFTHTITWSIGEASGIICEKSTDTEIPWAPPIDLAWQITNSAVGRVALSIASYSGETLIGSPMTVYMDVAVPEDVIPSAEAQWTDASNAFDIMGTYIKLVSRLSVDVIGTGIYGSSIVGASVTLNGRAYTGSAIMDSGQLQLVATVTDSRGRSASAYYDIYVADYQTPSARVSASRCLEDGTADDLGEFAHVTVSGFVSPVDGANAATLVLRYGGSSKTETVPTGQINYSTIVPAPSVSTLAISAVVSDELLTSPESTMVLSIGYATVDYFAGGRGIAFGTTAKKEGFTCAMPTDFAGHTVAGLPQPMTGDAAAPKSYVDAAGEQLKKYIDSKAQAAADTTPIPISANVPMEVTMAQGDAAHISFITSNTANGDIFLLVNGKQPDNSGYSFAGHDSNFTGGQIGFSGSSFAAVVDADVRFHGSDLIVTGQDLRGNNTGAGRSFLVWRDLKAVENFSFSAAGTVVLVGIAMKAMKLPTVGKLSAQVENGVLQISGGISAEVAGGVLVMDGNIQASVENNVLVIKEENA